MEPTFKWMVSFFYNLENMFKLKLCFGLHHLLGELSGSVDTKCSAWLIILSQTSSAACCLGGSKRRVFIRACLLKEQQN